MQRNEHTCKKNECTRLHSFCCDNEEEVVVTVMTVTKHGDIKTFTVGCSSPSINFTSVVLPLPFSPNKTTRLLDVKPKSAL